MARDYAKIATSIWRSRKFQSLGAQAVHAKLLYFYLHTCPTANSVGCFHLPIGYIQIDLGFTEVQVRKGIDSLSIGYLIEWNEAEQLFRVVDFILHDPPTNPKHAMSLLSVAKALPACEQSANVYDDLAKVCRLKNLVDIAEQADRLSIGYREGIQTCRPLPSPSPLPLPKESISVAGAPSTLNGHGQDFDEWYAACPKRLKRFAAEKAYAGALRKPGATPAVLLDGIKRYAKSVEGKEKKFILHPTTWLNGGGWLDELELAPKTDSRGRVLRNPGDGPDPLLDDPARRLFAKIEAEEAAKRKANPSPDFE